MKKTCMIISALLLSVVTLVLIVAGNGALHGIDMTPGNFFTLSNTAKSFLGTVENNVEITVLQERDEFIDKGVSQPYFLQVSRILEAMESYNGNISVTYVNYSEAAEYKDSADEGDIVVKVGEKENVLADDSLFEFAYGYDEEGNTYSSLSASAAESVICSAIYDLTNTIKPKVVFSSGLGENENYKNYADMLTEAGYEVAYVDFSQRESIPDDCDLFILFAPSQDISYDIQSDIEAYMYNEGYYGKNCIYVANSAFGLDLPNIESFLSKWGISVEPYIVMETEEENFTSYGDAFYTEGFYMSDQFITDYNYMENAVTVPFSRSIEFDDSDTTLTGTVLIQSSETSCLTSWDSDGNVYYSEEGTFTNVQNVTYYQTDYAGQVQTGIEGSITVIGSECAFEQEILDSSEFSNQSYFLDITDGMSGKNDVSVSIMPKYYTMKGTSVTDTARPALVIIFVIILPLTLAVVGLIIFVRRRKTFSKKI